MAKRRVRHKTLIKPQAHEAPDNNATAQTIGSLPGISKMAIDAMWVRTKRKATPAYPFAPFEPARGVLPPGKTGAKLAMDAGFDVGQMSAIQGVNQALDQGYAWPGFNILSEWSQIPEFRRPAETYAREMTRKWINIVASSDDDKTDKIKKIEKEFKRLNVQSIIRRAIELDGLFGRSQIFIDVGSQSSILDKDELKTELVESPAKISIGSLKRLAIIEPIWSYPGIYNANDPLSPTFFKPESWYVMGKEIHSSRFIRIVTREVPDILKPAYAFAGLSLSQMIKPYVDNWLRTRQSVSDLIHSFTVWTLKTDLSSLLNQGGYEQIISRLQAFNLGRDNHGVNAINNGTEDFSNVSAPLGSLDKLQAQAQEQISSATGIPLVYSTGITPSGLNASSAGEIECFQDTMAATQEILTPAISKIMNIVQLSLFGEIDADIGVVWNQLKIVTEHEKAEIRKIQAETDAIYLQEGIITSHEVRGRIASDDESPYAGLDMSLEIDSPGNNNNNENEDNQGAPNGQNERAPIPMHLNLGSNK